MMRIHGLLLLTLSLLLCLPVSAQALSEGTFRLGNHRDGNAADPLYGLRLDGLFDGNASTIVTFDFEGADGMFLDYSTASGGTLRIHGEAVGGVDGGSAHVNPELFQIDFLYTEVTDGTGGALVSDLGSGSITRISDAMAWNLEAYAGNHDHAFYLALGHRGNPGYSGVGWLNHAPVGESMRRLPSSDWLFEVGQPIPEPGAAMLFGAGLLVVSRMGRRARP